MPEHVVDTARKAIMRSLGFLDNKYIRTALIILLIVYNSAIITDVNVAVSRVINIPLVKLALVIVIVCLGLKDKVLAILLTMAVVMSTYYSVNNEYFSIQNMVNKVREGMGSSSEEEHKRGSDDQQQQDDSAQQQDTQQQDTQQDDQQQGQMTSGQVNERLSMQSSGTMQSSGMMQSGPVGYSSGSFASV
jgi:hypothetical protein